MHLIYVVGLRSKTMSLSDNLIQENFLESSSEDFDDSGSEYLKYFKIF